MARTELCIYAREKVNLVRTIHSHDITPTFVIPPHTAINISQETALALEGGLIRPLGLWRDSGQVPALATLPVDQRRVLRHAVVPHNHGLLLPLDTGLEVSTESKMVVQELQERVRLLLF